MAMILENEKKELIKDLINELRKQKIISKATTAKESTERLLREFTKLKLSIVKISNQIKSLEKENKKLKPKISKTNRVALKDKEHIYLYTDETLETRINELKQIKIRTQNYIDYVEGILKEFQDDEYYPIIEWLYFENKSQKEISDFFGWADSTVTKHKSILLEQMSTLLFPDLFIKEING